MRDAFIIGGKGVVGQATAKALKIPYYYDLQGSNITLKKGAKKKYCFICLPTPTEKDGSQKSSVAIIRAYLKKIKNYGTDCLFVIRSTLLPGTCKSLSKDTGAKIVYNPEFLSESTAVHDATHPLIKVVGADDPALGRQVINLWKKIKCPLEISTNTATAEMIKYVFNVFAVVKIVFANQIYDLCQKNGADYEVIHRALHLHPWGSKNHFRVLDKGGRGAGGRCFPKDIKAFAKYSHSKFLKLVEKINLDYLKSSGKE